MEKDAVIWGTLAKWLDSSELECRVVREEVSSGGFEWHLSGGRPAVRHGWHGCPASQSAAVGSQRLRSLQFSQGRVVERLLVERSLRGRARRGVKGGVGW
jgi:hypothetical protein